MSAKNHVRFGLLCLASTALAGCASHTYGVSVAPRAGYEGATNGYLSALGYVASPYQTGVLWSMEHRHGDSVDRVAIVEGGPAPTMSSFTMPASGGAAYLPGGGGVAQSTSNGAYMGGLNGGGKGGPVLEVTCYRLDRSGKRHPIEPSDAVLSQADSVITLITGIPSSMRR